jgi:hypothetical protein
MTRVFQVMLEFQAGWWNQHAAGRIRGAERSPPMAPGSPWLMASLASTLPRCESGGGAAPQAGPGAYTGLGADAAVAKVSEVTHVDDSVEADAAQQLTNSYRYAPAPLSYHWCCL